MKGDEKPERVNLIYRYRIGPGAEWEDVQEPISLEWTACNFGGERPWFVCPGAGCGRRVALLYGPGRYFLCRHISRQSPERRCFAQQVPNISAY